MQITVDDNIQHLQRLFPKWEYSDEILRLWRRRLTPLDQNRVRQAIEQERVDSGRFTAPDLGKVLDRFKGKTDDQGGAAIRVDPKAAWQKYLDALPEDERCAALCYWRILDVASDHQRKAYLAEWFHFAEMVRRDPLGLKGCRVLLDADLPRKAAQLFSQTQLPAMNIAQQREAWRRIIAATKSVVIPRRKVRTVAEVVGILEKLEHRRRWIAQCQAQKALPAPQEAAA